MTICSWHPTAIFLNGPFWYQNWRFKRKKCWHFWL